MMAMMTVHAPAKVNMALDITGKRADGYHLMRMVNFTCDVADTLTFEAADDLTLSCNDPAVPVGDGNLILKAAGALKSVTGFNGGARISLIKRIPMQAGLAGGSADCAAALKGLNQLWQLGLSRDDLANIGLQLGADVPYCLDNRPALVEGIGEIITPLDPFPDYHVVIVKPDINVSTPAAFDAFDRAKDVSHPDIDGLLSAIAGDARTDIAALAGDAFEPVIFRQYPSIQTVKEKLLAAGAAFALMSGSGSTVAGYFDDLEKAKAAANAFTSDDLCFVTRIVKERK